MNTRPDVIAVLERIRRGEPTTARHRILVGESDDATRRGDKTIVAWTDARYRCSSWDQLEQLALAIQDSDERLRARPDDLMLWDWDNTYMQLDNPEDPTEGGGTILLGVAWYSIGFFIDRGGAGFSYMHQRLYERLGLSPDDITVQHFLCADVADFKPALVPTMNGLPT
ncbi:hypothetical protein [Micromonospora aurantiaca (nom. illeg.)]|uniref:hypothetical protein n=1 Tax=Micromonospora aurantiaca (nom. illeg.) TaxID=47850 RepID=UPI0033E8BB4B